MSRANQGRIPRALVIDDEAVWRRELKRLIERENFKVDEVKNSDDALGQLRENHYDLVTINLGLPGESKIAWKVIEHRIRTDHPATKIFIVTGDPTLETAMETINTGIISGYFNKNDFNVDLFVKKLRTVSSASGQPVFQGQDPPRIFIVHGRDRETLLELKNFIQNGLKLGEPIILAEKPSHGMTLIEKFEYYASDADLVFVLFTPDDLGALADLPEASQLRPRMNVLFEYGYFFGRLKRRSGRVLLLTKGEIEFLSDIAGVIYIDISNGVEAAGQEIRVELQEWI